MLKNLSNFSAIAAAAIAFPASAQMEQPSETKNCAPGPANLPAELSGWAHPRTLAAAKSLSTVQKATLTAGEAVDATLVRTSELHYPLRPEKPGGSVSFGGLFSFTVKEQGIYRVALGSGAWIDIIADGKAFASSTHGRGPDCSAIRKMVDFPLSPGDYILQIAANGSPSLTLMLARLP